MLEARITELETKLAYQEDTLQTLNDTVYQQQKRIEHLQRQLEVVLNRLADLSGTQPTRFNHSQEQPPHY